MTFRGVLDWFKRRFRRAEDDLSCVDDFNNICNFCTIGSEKYLIKLVTLYRSLRKSGCRFRLWVLSMDAFTYDMLKHFDPEDINIVPVKTLEKDAEILKAKDGKAENEYCWMLKAPLMEYVLAQENIPSVMYIDSDLYFFKDPSQIFEHFTNHSIYLCPQRDMDYVEQKYGRYQAGLIGFKNDEEGREALHWWKTKCLEWCRHEYDGHRYGDQKYLDEIPRLFNSVKFEDNYGVNAAPWNCVYNKERSVEIRDEKPLINGDEIIAFHFACITIYSISEFDLWNLDKLEIPRNILRKIYRPYINDLMETTESLLEIAPFADAKIFSDKKPDTAKTYFVCNKFGEKQLECGVFYHICAIVSNEYLVRVIALYKSLMRHQDNFNLWLCTIDKAAYETLIDLDLPNVTVISAEKVEGDRYANISEKHDKSEYCWILKSVFIEYLFDSYMLEKVLYCDADMYFYSTVNYIFDEWGSYSLLMATQRADVFLEQANGQYQAGLLGFRNDSYGREILTWWKENCINWCYDWADAKMERWGDQKYLERVPMLFENIKVSHNLGINAAPWNLILNDKGYSVTGDTTHVLINNYLLCAYHFGSMQIIDLHKFDLWHKCNITIKPEIIEHIYMPYIENLYQTMKELIEMGFSLDAFICPDCERSAKNLYNLEDVK